jgi:uncharacterized protein (DUF3084 family)
MVHFGASGERRDDTATDRDDAAEGRDVAATGRDAAATQRDARAGDRDDRAGRDADDLRDRLTRTSRQDFDRFAGLDDVVVDPADWPELSAAGLARLRTFAAEQRLLGALDHAAVRALCDDLRSEIEHGRLERRAAARDREAAAADRNAADRDRGLAEQDRADAARDRDQAAIERQQDSPTGPPQPDGTDESLAGRVARAMADSRRRITDSRAYLADGLGEARPAVPTPDPAASAPDG